MFENICRLCLSNHDLGPIFVNSEQSESNTAILALTTGLKIEPNDGFPQKICSRCTELVNSALTLRNQCHAAHLKIVQMIQDEKSLMKEENNSSNSCENGENVYKNDFEHDSIEDCGDNTGLTKFEIEIQCDRLTEDQNGGNSKQDGDKVSRKKVREMYMELVEGVFNPKGPVKCKVCKKTVSSWECFRGHAKLHLQGKKVICEIEPNDGFPQKICSRCTELVNSALTLRNQCHAAHLKLVQMIQDEKSLMKDENNSSNSCENGENVYKNDFEHDSIEDCGDNNGLTKFQIEIQCDRLTDDQNGGNSKQDGVKISRKKVREMYMELVEGVFNPKGPVKCKVCKKTVSSWECFRGHAKLHLQGKKVICEYCGKSFASSAQLKRHCMSFHGMARELACKHCSFLALDKPQLMVHERRMHTGERPYVCDVCAAAYFSRPCLVQHIETHRESATVQCEQCPQKFKSARHLARHRYKAHVRTRRKRCEVK